jgi:hypothetical protein
MVCEMDDRPLYSKPLRTGLEADASSMGSIGRAARVFEEIPMLVGHVAVAFIGKRTAPKLSLGTVMFAALLSDLLWCVFMIAGLEHVVVKPGVTVVSGMRAVDVLEASEISYSHSLLMTAIWGAVLSLVYFSARRNVQAAWVLFAVVVSHWILDFVSHPPDMPLLPGATQQRFGLGLWKSVPATLIVEGAFWILAIVIYLRAARPRTRAGLLGFWIAVLILTLAWIGNILGPPPADISTIGFSSFTFFTLTVVWAYWMNRRIEFYASPARASRL